MAYQRIIGLGLIILAAQLLVPRLTVENTDLLVVREPSARPETKSTQQRAQKKDLAPLPSPTVVPQALIPRAHQLKSCLSERNCPYPKKDPRAYDLAVGQDLKSLLIEAYDIADQLNQRDLYELIELGATFADGHVLSEVLKLLDFGQDDLKNSKALLTALNQSAHDSVLLEKALSHLVQHKKLPEVQSFVQSNIEFGGHYSSQFLAKKAHHLMTEENLEQFQSLLQRLRGQSASHKALKASIDEFLKRRSGA